jgi:hypothetical protein
MTVCDVMLQHHATAGIFASGDGSAVPSYRPAILARCAPAPAPRRATASENWSAGPFQVASPRNRRNSGFADCQIKADRAHNDGKHSDQCPGQMRASADRAGGNPDSKNNDTYRDGERDRVIHDCLQRPVPVGSMPVRQQVSASTRARHST